MQAILILFTLDSRIEELRKKYYPDYDKYKPHITLVYEFAVDDQDALRDHIRKTVDPAKPFTMSLHGLKKSDKGNYLYLLVERGKEECVALYASLNRAILAGFDNKNIPFYHPHMTLGIFKTEEDLNDAMKAIGDIEFTTKISEIHLIDVETGEVEAFSLD